MTRALPPSREPGVYRIGMVCLGNICRSPTAEVVLRARLDEATGTDGRPLSEWISVDSVGTGDWHLGEPMDVRAARTLAASGYDPSQHRARQIETQWLATRDLVLTMDEQNLTRVRRLATPEQLGRVMPFRMFDPTLGPDAPPAKLEVPDPWSGGQGGFDEVLTMVERAAASLATALAAHAPPRHPRG